MGYVLAFDVETPNRHQDRICEIGITLLEEGKITLSSSMQIDPECEFDEINIGFHGICPEDVEGCPNFKEFWEEFGRYFINADYVIAHSARFDLAVLVKTLRAYGVSSFDLHYVDTLALSRYCFPELPKHGLAVVAEALGFDLDHHNAKSDAEVCARIYCKAIEQEVDIDLFTKLYPYEREGTGLPKCEPCPKRSKTSSARSKKPEPIPTPQAEMLEARPAISISTHEPSVSVKASFAEPPETAPSTGFRFAKPKASFSVPSTPSDAPGMRFAQPKASFSVPSEHAFDSFSNLDDLEAILGRPASVVETSALEVEPPASEIEAPVAAAESPETESPNLSSRIRKRRNKREPVGIIELLGGLKDIIEDSVVDLDELEVLAGWMEEHPELENQFPYNVIVYALEKILEDNIIEPEELEWMYEIFKTCVNPVESLPENRRLAFKGKLFCIDSDLSIGSKDEIARKIVQLGGEVKDGVLKKTDYLVIGAGSNENIEDGNYGVKIKRAIEWQVKGQPIRIICEADFIEALRAASGE